MLKLRPDEMGRLSVEGFRQAEKVGLVVVLDNIRSAYNVGAMFRTADAFRIEGLAVCGVSPYPPSPLIHKTALGAEEAVDWKHFGSAVEAVEGLKKKGYLVCGLEITHSSVDIRTFVVPRGQKVALVVGNEVHGVEEEVLRLCDECVEIPQRGTKHSLNVASAAAIAMWHIVANAVAL